MNAETPTPPTSTRAPRKSLLVALGVALAGLVAYSLWPSAGGPGAPSNSPGGAARTQAAPGAFGDPASLDVRIGRLKEPPPAPDDMERNPFRFQPKAPPPPPAPPPQQQQVQQVAPQPMLPQGPPPPPPIGQSLKFIGRLDSPSTGVVAIFSDNHGRQPHGKEGETILGQYRIVKIGVESVTMEYLDGRGRTTLPLSGGAGGTGGQAD
jgi:hypothetical protein